MGKIDVFKLSHGVGDRVVIYRNSGGGDIRGVVEDIGDGIQRGVNDIIE